jgi:NAD(P)-dependent dehydrogenase (short-subunit alcohol dehydrogenase family)
MDAHLRGKTALVTGGTSGIGLAIAEALIAEGVRVAVASRHPESELASLDSTAKGLPELSVIADVSHEDQVIRMIEETVDHFGQLDLFVNNAAQALHQPITRIETDTFRKVLDTNLSACLWSCRQVAKHMISRRRGAILVVGSTSMYTPGPGETVYRITKFGLKAIVQNLAIELAPYGIRANLLVPGHYRTRLTANIPAPVEQQLAQQIPLRRFGETRECGNAGVFLLSDALSGYTTGAEMVVDGGLSLRPLYFGDDSQLQGLNSLD